MLSEIFCRFPVSGQEAGLGLGSGVPRVIYFDVTRRTALFPKQESITLGAGWHSVRRWFVYSPGGGRERPGSTPVFTRGSNKIVAFPALSCWATRISFPLPTDETAFNLVDDSIHTTQPTQSSRSPGPRLCHNLSTSHIAQESERGTSNPSTCPIPLHLEDVVGRQQTCPQHPSVSRSSRGVLSRT